MQVEELRRDYKRQYGTLSHIFRVLRITNVYHNDHRDYFEEVPNLYNPLTYLLCLIGVVYSFFRESLPRVYHEIKDEAAKKFHPTIYTKL